jgi:hypothetical protein
MLYLDNHIKKEKKENLIMQILTWNDCPQES